MFVEVSIEETLVKTVKVDVPDDVEDALSYAQDAVKAMYFDSQIVLGADDFADRQISATDANGYASEYKSF